MCGIIAGITKDNILPDLVYGLEKLEYRGYDSAGIAIAEDNKIKLIRTLGKVKTLKQMLLQNALYSNIGIAHTRWATHGKPSESNAHPHATEKVAVVHNGIIENYIELKSELKALGYDFKSETDTEVITNYLDYYLTKGYSLNETANKVIDKLDGTYGLAILFKDPQVILATAHKNQMVFGISDNGKYVASDAMAFSDKVNEIIYLEDGDKVLLKNDSYSFFDKKNILVDRKKNKFHITEEISKSPYPHFMLKEIHEQPLALKGIFEHYLKDDYQFNVNIDWKTIDRIKIIACGSAYISGFVSKYWIEELAQIHVDVEIASEYRYRESPHSKNGVTIVISQSGETLDSLEALKKAKSYGEKIISIINAERSSIARSSDFILPIMVGAEIGVASTKAFMGQLAVLATLALDIGTKTGHIGNIQNAKLKTMMTKIPSILHDVLTQFPDDIRTIANQMTNYTNALFIGRKNLYPIALEGALKLKELSYIHAEAYASGELKHGPISLLDSNMPVIVLIPSSDNILFDKILSNLQEVVARGAKTLCIVCKEDKERVKDFATWIITIPYCDEFTAPFVYTLPLQLLAYHIANLKGHDVDQPRNLAKSVTVE